jgi:murein DD-endopeptidase MepM/ murein hydrolase activator NlpD
MRSPGFTIMIHRDGALDSRQWRVPLWAFRLITISGITVAGLLAISLALYLPIVAAAARAPLLARRVHQLEAENQRVVELARLLEDAEARYSQLRNMLGADVALPQIAVTDVRTAATDRLYVAPPLEARPPRDSAAPPRATGPSIPSRWPLTVPSFRTRGLAQGDPGTEAHMGLDLAVPVGSDVRASGGGTVANTGNDPAYGLFVLIRHPDGYESMYGHLSRVLVTEGAQVRAGQVIALSGNTGRSTAPHLHFEIRRNGRSIDPMTLVREGQ